MVNPTKGVFFSFLPHFTKEPHGFFEHCHNEDNKGTMLPLVPLIIQLFVECELLCSPMWIIDFVIVMPN